MTKKKTEDVPSFEDGLEKLEAIVDQMENGQLPLEKLIVRYEEGSKLLDACEQKLKDAERKIEILRSKDPAKPEFSDFEGEE